MASLGYLKVSDWVFCYVLVQPSLILHCAWYAIVEPLVGVSSVAVSAAAAVAAQHGQPQDPLGCSTTFLGEGEVEGVVGKYGVPGENESGERLLDMCVEQEMVIGNCFFKKKGINYYYYYYY